MILVLIAAAVVSGITAVHQGESFADTIICVFMLVVVINAVLGVYQELRLKRLLRRCSR